MFRTVIAAVATMLASSTAFAQTVEQVAQRQTGRQVVWDWSGERPVGGLTASFVRANVRIVRSDRNTIDLHVTSPDPDGNGSAAALMISRHDGILRIVDRYPPTPPFAAHECLPPDGEHGGPWIFDDRLEVLFVLPSDLKASVTTMSGTISGR